MKKCIELAKLAEGLTSPNPLVGCVVLDKNGKEIATGNHTKYGSNHAERDALLKIEPGQGHTLIVNLEPCSHHGKTPPCADFIIKMGIKRVIIGMLDPNPIVSGRGVEKLKNAGIDVQIGICKDECENLNEVFIKNMIQEKVFVAIKTATTLDGKIATSTGSSKWITSDNARNEVKKIRNRYDAIMTSSSTITADQPTMAHRKKIILDRNLKTDLNTPIYKEGDIYIFNSQYNKNENNLHFIKTPTSNDKLDLDFILSHVYKIGIRSILVESGGYLNGEMLKYADKIYHFIAPKITGDNTALSCFNYQQISNINESKNFKIDNVQMFPPDVLITYKPMYKN